MEQAREHYRQQQDYGSLRVLHQQLEKGMDRDDVEALLGKPEYSPITGVDYYPSDHRSAEQGYAALGLVVEYNDAQGEATQQVQNYWLGQLGE
ncbi:MAG: hypothetical protein R3E89_04325 [Thiolinea sp.]